MLNKGDNLMEEGRLYDAMILVANTFSLHCLPNDQTNIGNSQENAMHKSVIMVLH